MSILIKKKRTISRRTVLRGLLGGAAVSLALPPLEIMFNSTGTAYAGGGGLPTRFGLFFWGNGMLPDRWTPIGEGSGIDWVLSEQLTPLAPIKHKISVVSGMSVKVPNRIPHYSGAGGFLTGIDPIGEEGDNTFAGPSIDQIIAAEIGGETLFRSIEVGSKGGGVSHNGPHSQNPMEKDPHILYERLFGPTFRAPGEDPIIDPKLGLRRSVLDAVTQQTHALRTQVGVDDQHRLDQYLEGVRDLELRLARLEEDPPNLAACERPDEPADAAELESLSARNRALTDLLVMAAACDQTRVFSNCLTSPVNNHVFPGASAGHHQLTHDEPGEQPQVNEIVQQIMVELEYFLTKMDSIEEGDGTLLDHSAVLCTSEISLGKTHSLDEMPIIIAGTANGALRTDMHYRSTTRENASKVQLSLVRAMGILTPGFGEGDSRAEEGLAAIEA